MDVELRMGWPNERRRNRDAYAYVDAYPHTQDSYARGGER